MKKPIKQRIIENIRIDGDKWEWTGSVCNGIPIIYDANIKNPIKVRRFLYAEKHGIKMTDIAKMDQVMSSRGGLDVNPYFLVVCRGGVVIDDSHYRNDLAYKPKPAGWRQAAYMRGDTESCSV